MIRVGLCLSGAGTGSRPLAPSSENLGVPLTPHPYRSSRSTVTESVHKPTPI